MMKMKSNAVKGFTLIEMMMTLSIAAILITIAAPSYSTFTKKSAITKQVNLLAASVSMSRGEAAKRGIRVTMCASSSPTESEPPCDGASGDWSNGWVVFVDTNSNSDYDSGEIIIEVYTPETGVDIQAQTDTNALGFNPDGTTNLGSRDFAVCHQDMGLTNAKELNIAGTGRPSMSTATTCSPA